MISLKKFGENYYTRLTHKMTALVIVVSLTPLILVSAMILNEFRASYRDRVHAHLSVVIKKHKLRIDSFLNEKLADIKHVAASFSFEQLSDEKFLQARLRALQNSYGIVFEDLGVIDENGIQIAYTGPFELMRAQYSEAEWFNKAIMKKFYISDVFLGLRGLPHFIVSVRSTHEGKPWLLRATIDFHAFNSLVENLRIGETGIAFILNREGQFQTQSLAGAAVNKQIFLDLMKDKNDLEEVYMGERRSETGREDFVYVISLLKDGEWAMVYQQNMSDAYSNFNNTRNIAILIIMLGGLVIVTMAFLLSGVTVARIAAADREKEMLNEQVIETGKLASIGELASGIAHEINNPVAIMVEEAGWIQDLLEEEEFQKSENLDEFVRALNQINLQGKRCKEITHKLLSFARKTDSRLQRLQINELVADVVGLSAQRAKYASVTINTSLYDAMPTIPASHTEFQQVFLNLINNAMDAMEKTGGKIDIETKLKENNIVITVSDTGPGIPAANLSRIFDPFYTTKPVGKGTGLGLSICYGIVKKMGGEIDVHSVIGEGTTFQIMLPMDKETEGRKKPESAEDVASSENHDEETVAVKNAAN